MSDCYPQCPRRHDNGDDRHKLRCSAAAGAAWWMLLYCGLPSIGACCCVAGSDWDVCSALPVCIQSLTSWLHAPRVVHTCFAADAERLCLQATAVHSISENRLNCASVCRAGRVCSCQVLCFSNPRFPSSISAVEHSGATCIPSSLSRLLCLQTPAGRVAISLCVLQDTDACTAMTSHTKCSATMLALSI